jgi:hypothetical protein
MDDDRLLEIEHEQSELRDVCAQMRNLLQTLTSRLENLEFARSEPTTPTSINSIVHPTESQPKSRLKPSTPFDFDGDRTKGRGFLNSCDLYMSLCPSEFIDDQAKILWVLSYMKTDRAAAFADRLLRHRAKFGKHRYTTFDQFRSTFATMFCPENEATHALIRLESERYFQGKRTVEAYIDEFENLVDLSGYSDNLAIVMKLRRGLNTTIQDKIAESGSDRPSDDDIDGWYKAARRFDQNRLANEAFHSSSLRRTTVPTAAPPRNTFPRPSGAATPAATSIRPSLTTIDPSTPPANCHRCGKPGHYQKDCPWRFNIHRMTTEEKEAAFQDFLASKDVAQEPSSLEGSDSEIEVEGDFVSNSE